ncbi:hypothetical protein HanIR_Chr03g0131711 [Helianthus annuus]|nr:hypothetical protein HanIR_Chr03g0131711 [Helianthus annuus]
MKNNVPKRPPNHYTRRYIKKKILKMIFGVIMKTLHVLHVANGHLFQCLTSQYDLSCFFFV